MPVSASYVAECACGRVAFEGRGKPMIKAACYCDDCQAAARYVESLPGGKSGMGADGGTLSILYPRDQVRCVRGEELLQRHKLTPKSPMTRLISSCCHSSLSAQQRWMPQVPLRSFAPGSAAIEPELCIFTKYAPSLDAITHAAPRYRFISPGFALKLTGATIAQLLLSSSARMDWI